MSRLRRVATTSRAWALRSQTAADTTDRIAERAGVSIGTLYQYPHKQSLLDRLVEHHVLDAQLHRVPAPRAVRRERVLVLVRALCDADRTGR